MPIIHSLLKSKLARRLVIYVLIFSSIVTLVLTAIQLYRDYEYDLSLIDSKFAEIQSTNQSVLEDNLWLLNTTSMSLLLDGILRHQDIVYLSITDENDEIIMWKGVLPDNEYKQMEIPLNYHYRNQTHHLGHFKIVATLDYVYKRLLETTFIILISQTVKTFLVSLFIILIVWFLITRHLASIKEYALGIEIENHQVDLSLKRKESYWTENDEFSHLTDAINLMRKKLYNSYIRIEHQSLHDPLTRLPNRRLMEDRLKHELAQSERQNIYGAILFVDLDHFKLLNDSLGHSIGDQILIETANRLNNVIRKGDTVARIGGDEFIILLSLLSHKNSTSSREAYTVANKVQRKLDHKMMINDRHYSVTASIGIALFKGDEDDCESVLKHADNAMYKAKAEGRNKISLFHSQMQDEADYLLQIEQKLHDAIKHEEFTLFYQPKYDQMRNIRSAEVLIRWQQSEGDYIAPNIFIPIAEETGLIVPIGYQVLSMVFKQVEEERDVILRSGLKSIAINISPHQFSEPDFAEHVISEVNKHHLDASFFILELTEDAVVHNVTKTIETMNILKRHGFKLSIDDFGMGYSSLRYLKDFPLDELKIDKAFVDHIVDNKDDFAIVRSIISMAKNLNLDVVAEGVELEEQFQLLLENDCQLFQGFLLSMPLPHRQFIEMLRSDK